jgi:hypothetical protein
VPATLSYVTSVKVPDAAVQPVPWSFAVTGMPAHALPAGAVSGDASGGAEASEATEASDGADASAVPEDEGLDEQANVASVRRIQVRIMA